jgi:hypothetical protein
MRKLFSIIVCISLLSGCSGTIIHKPDRTIYQNFHGKLSCLGLRCCYPWSDHPKFIICNEGNATGDGVFLRYYYDK